MNQSKPQTQPLHHLVHLYAQHFQLSDREEDILHLLTRRIVSAEGIGTRLRLSKNTVRVHLQNIFQKTDTGSKTELLATLIQFAMEGPADPDHLT